MRLALRALVLRRRADRSGRAESMVPRCGIAGSFAMTLGVRYMRARV